MFRHPARGWSGTLTLWSNPDLHCAYLLALALSGNSASQGWERCSIVKRAGEGAELVPSLPNAPPGRRLCPSRDSTSWVREHTHPVSYTDGAAALPGALWESFPEEVAISTECRIHVRACE